MERILNGEVEEIKMVEKCKSPTRRERINSPVKVLAQHVKRIDMGTNPAQKLLSDNMTAPQMFGGSIESDS